jgi:hypothetical protein
MDDVASGELGMMDHSDRQTWMSAARIGWSVAILFFSQGIFETRAAEDSNDILRGRVERLASEILSNSVSDYFTLLTGLAQTDSTALSAKQVELTGRFDKLARSVLSEMLLRDLGKATRSELARRLSKDGQKQREEIVVCVESIVTHTILSKRQEDRIRKALGRKIGHSAPSRYGRQGCGLKKATSTPEELQEAILEVDLCLTQRSLSNLFGMTLQEKNDFGVVNPDPRRNELAREFDELARDAVKYNFSNAFNVKLEKLGFEECSKRYQAWDGMRDAVVALSEIILLDGILSEEEAERALRTYWRKNWQWALLDPTLTGRLGMTKTQVTEVARRIRLRTEFRENCANNLLAEKYFDEEGIDITDRVYKERKMMVGNADAYIFEPLKKKQLQDFLILINEKELPIVVR